MPSLNYFIVKYKSNFVPVVCPLEKIKDVGHLSPAIRGGCLVQKSLKLCCR
jgi:hypothetical protein